MSPEFMFHDHLQRHEAHAHPLHTGSSISELLKTHTAHMAICLYVGVCPDAHQNQLPIALWRPSLPAPALFMYAIMSLSHCADDLTGFAL